MLFKTCKVRRSGEKLSTISVWSRRRGFGQSGTARGYTIKSVKINASRQIVNGVLGVGHCITRKLSVASAPITIAVNKDSPRGSERIIENTQVGDVICGYRVLRKMKLEDRGFVIYELLHESTGGRHLHVECDDKENAFSIAFRTIPSDDKGIPHVLEHMSLCGSERYPVRDPFFRMLKRSVNSYMNACTGSDYTCYLFSTMVPEDYYNLMSVYLDAVYQPKLNYLDFLQEGYRVALNPDGDPLHGGVVYNEMKGAFSDTDRLFLSERMRALYQGSPYQYVSGGDPESIRQLEYQDLLNFHKRYYQASNSYVFTYGDLPLRDHLNFLSTNFYANATAKSNVGNESTGGLERWKSPRSMIVHGPLSSISDPKRQVRVSLSWLTNGIEEGYKSFQMSVLSYLLMSGPDTPLYRDLITSGLGTTFLPGTGYDSSTSDCAFSVGVSGVSDETYNSLEQVIMRTLEHVEKNGFEAGQVEAALHSLELRRCEVTTGYGLALFEGTVSYWINGHSPLDVISLKEYMQRLEGDLKENPRLFCDLIAQQLLNNTHRLTFIMLPDPEYTGRLQKQEDEHLRHIHSALLSDSKFAERVARDEQNLSQYQASTIANRNIGDDVLPRIHLNSISRNVERAVESRWTDLTLFNGQQVPVLWNAQPTNGIVYFRASFDITDTPSSWLPYVPIGAHSMHRLGTKDMNYEALSRAKDQCTGRFTMKPQIVEALDDDSKYRLKLFATSSCLTRNVTKMFDIWSSVTEHVRFDEQEYFRVLLASSNASMHDDLIENGHLYAQLLAASAVNPMHRMAELWEGVTQYRLLRDLDAPNSNQTLTVLDSLRDMFDWIFDLRRLKIAINAEKRDFAAIEDGLSQWLSRLPLCLHGGSGKETLPHERILDWKRNTPSRKTYVALPSQVNYVAQILRTVPYTHEDYSKFSVAACLMSWGWLHREVREKRGAYGCGVSHNGMLNFYSYRDPCVEETLESFSDSIKWLAKSQYTDEEFEEAKIELLSNLDSPVPPSAKNLNYFYTQLSDEMRQRERDAIFNMTRDDISELCARCLTDDMFANNSSVAVFGNKENVRFKNDSTWTWVDQ